MIKVFLNQTHFQNPFQISKQLIIKGIQNLKIQRILVSVLDNPTYSQLNHILPSISNLFTVSINQMDEHNDTPYKSKFQLGYFRLTHELIKNIKINEITYAFFAFIQTLQIVHFSFRQKITGRWDNTVFKYLEMAINYISVDYLVESNPTMFTSINVGVFAIMLITILVMVLFAWQLRSDKKPTSIVKSIFPLLNFTLYIYKTVLQIPIIVTILISLNSSYKVKFGISESGVQILLGVLNIILFTLIQLYLITSFKDCNPFSDLIHAGENYTKSAVAVLYKLSFAFYMVVDYQGKAAKIFLITFAIFNTLFIIYRHMEIGLYKTKMRNLRLKLHYAVIMFSFISLMKIIRPTDETSILFQLIIGCLMCYIVCDYVQKCLALRILEKKMMFIKNESDLEEHILHLIRNIDTFEKRQSRIMLEGYLAYHHRQCKLPQTSCICHHLKQVKQRTAEQKSQFFLFAIDILKQNLNRFTDAKKIHLMMSFIFQYRQKNRFQALYSLTRTLKQDTFLNRLYFYHQTNLIQSQMIQDDSKDSNNKAVDINKFFQYNNLIVFFQEMLQQCTRYHISFWKQLLEVNTDIKKLQISGTMVTNSKDNVRDEFQRMLVLNPNNIHTLNVYGKFLIDVANQQASNIKYLEKAQSIFKNLKESSKIDDNSNKYTDNAQTTIIIIQGNEVKLGEIAHTNNYVKKMIGYKRSQCIGTNVNSIMPKIFGESHNQVLEKYLSTSSDKYNGKERIVPVLAKNGYMIPAVALTKALPDLEQGIRIVGFISKLQQRPQEEEIIRKYFYILYRSDNQQVVGITQNCYTEFHIPCCLVYGNPYNNSNELKIRNLFGFSFQKDKEGQVATALQTSEVVLTLNSTKLSQQFIISRNGNGTNQQIKDDLLQLDSSDFGVQVKIVAKCILGYHYQGIPLKMLSIYKYGEDCFESKNEQVTDQKSQMKQASRYFQKTQNDDFKDLKDFKNFISIKSQPSAISVINNICCVLMFVIASCIVTFIMIWVSLKGQNTKILAATGKGLRNQIIIPNLLFEVEKFYINRNPNLSLNKFDEIASQAKIKSMISLIKKNEREFLPLKYSFINDYNRTIKQYSFDTLGAITAKQVFIDELVTLYISQVQSLMDSQLQTLYTDPIRYDSNPFLIYLSIKNNELFSIRKGSLQTVQDVIVAYTEQVTFHKTVFYVLTSVLLFGVVLWFFTSIPYVLSVTKINNRVLSLFSLIPNHDVLRLIGRSYMYIKENLTQAIINEEEADQILEDRNLQNQNQSLLGASSLGFGINSPAPFLAPKSPTQDSSHLMFKKSSASFNQSGSPLSIQQKFTKMVNSQNQQKNKTIFQFLILSLILIGYFIFNHFYALGNVNSIQYSVQNLKNLGRRISILTNVKLLLSEYIMDEKYRMQSGLPSIKDLNNMIIDESYAIERILLKVDIGSESATLDKYNSGNLCNFIDDYKNSNIFATTFDKGQCLTLKQGILVKGLKTSIVTMLQEVRTILSMTSFTNRAQLLEQKIKQYQAVIKYLQSPMFKIITNTQNEVTQTNASYELVLIICSSIFLVIVVGFWRIIWTIYIEELNNKIWRTKGMLNIIPMRIITANQLLKNEFASGQLEKAVR